MRTSLDRWLTAVMVLLVLMLATVFLGGELESRLGVSPVLVFAVLLVVALGILLTTVGPLPGGRGRVLALLLAIGVVGFLGTVIAIVLLDGSPAADERRILGMLPSTALLVLGVWGLPYLFVAAYVALFSRSVLGPEEERRIAAARRESSGAAPEVSDPQTTEPPRHD